MSATELVPWYNRSSLQRHEEPFDVMRREMDRLFNEFDRGIDDWPAWNGDRSGTISPRINIIETDAAIEVMAELPGIDLEDIDVSYGNNLLTIKGEKRQEKSGEGHNYQRIERRYGSYYRTIQLPAELVDAQQMDATLKNGILTVTLPKRAEVQTVSKRVSVKQL